MDAGLVRELEAVAARSWPALETRALDGWLLRWSHGVTRRGCSVLARAGGTMPLDARLEAASAFYTERGAPLQFQVNAASVPEGLDALLASRGLLREAPTQVQVAHAAVVARSGAGAGVALDEGWSDEWFAAWRAMLGVAGPPVQTIRAMLQAVSLPVVHATLRDGDGPVAVGRGVLDSDWLGVFNMVTAQHRRRRGGATAVLSALAQWAAARGASRVYLQVESANAPALGLYARAGFAAAYDYWYRVAPRAEERA